MKFYFCETCGKRLTEHDIDGGVAKNKKLKGVFCKECAIGVTTMESLPLSDREAKKVLEEGAAQPQSSGPKQSRGRRSSAVRLPPGIRRGASEAKVLPGSSASRSAHNPYLKVVVPGVVVAIAFVGFLVASNGQRGTPGSKTKKKPGSRDRTKTLVSRKEKTAPSKPKTGIPADDKAPVELPKETDQPRPSPSPSPVTPKPSPEANPEVKDAPTVNPASGAPKPPDPQSKPGDVEAAKAKLAEYLQKFDVAVEKGDYASAIRIGGKAQADAALRAHEKETRVLVPVGEALLRGKESRDKALEAFLDGKQRTFQTAKGTIAGVVRKIEGETLRVRVEGRINKQVIEYEKRVKLVDLTPECRAGLLGGRKSETADEWVAEAIRRIGARDVASANVALAAAGAHPLVGHYRGRVEKIRGELREEEAQSFWQGQIAKLLDTDKFSKADARSGAQRLKAFRETYGKTKFAASMIEKVGILEKRFEVALGPPREVSLNLGKGVRIDFVLVPPGQYMMGDPSGSKDVRAALCRPQHRVTLTRAFYLSKYEVTQAQYEQVMGKNPGKPKGADLPVNQVSNSDVLAFCRRVSKRTGRRVRLPTEAEWEYACRAGSTTRYSFGDDHAELDKHGWHKSNSKGVMHPVGRKAPNGFGLFDMHGNVAEWCADYCARYKKGPVTDPPAVKGHQEKVVRGGHFGAMQASCRSAHRSPRWGQVQSEGIGLRAALDF